MLLAMKEIRLKLLSYNIQVGIQTGHHGHYFTRAWRHALPGPGMHGTLDRIAELMRDYDFVAIQEADAGSLRTQYTNQVEYLAKRAGFNHCGLTITRNLQPVARHALGYLSRHAPIGFAEHTLPSRLPGRRAIAVTLSDVAGGLQLWVTHLALRRETRHRQLQYLKQLLPAVGPVALMGDLNCTAAVLREQLTLPQGRLWVPELEAPTFPSWQPRQMLDHILLSTDIRLHQLTVLPHAISDHLPIAAEIGVELPA